MQQQNEAVNENCLIKTPEANLASHGPEPLPLRLAVALGLPGITYAPEYYHGPDYFVEPDLRRRFLSELAALSIEAINDEAIKDTLALEFIQSELMPVWQNDTLYHGSTHTNLTVLEPRQAAWDPTDITKPYKFADGTLAICAHSRLCGRCCTRIILS